MDHKKFAKCNFLYLKRKLFMIHRAKDLNDLRVLSDNRLEKLMGKSEDQYSIRINDQWRICFHWHDSNAFNVEIVDYHS